MIPYQDRYTLIGTTDVPVEAFERPAISQRGNRLPAGARQHLPRAAARARDVVWTFSGIRPLYDDGASDPSAITRDYVFKLDTGGRRRRAGAVDLRRQDHDLPQARRARARRAEAVPAADAAPWTKQAMLPGGDLPAGGLPAVDRRARAALPGVAGRAAARPRAPARHARAGDPRRREDARATSARTSATGSPRPRSTTWCARNGRAPATTCCGAGPSAGSGMTDGSARAWRRTWRRRGGGRCAAPMSDAPRETARRCGRSPRCRTTSAARSAACSPTSTTRCRRTAGSPPARTRAMERLRDAGKLVIPITGRPAGWCDHIARMWPVDAVVGENGALYMRYDAARAPARPAIRRRRGDAAREPRAARGDRRADPRRGARLRARVRSALPRGRPRDRLPRGRAAAAARGRSTASSR